MDRKQLQFLFIQMVELGDNLREEVPLKHSG